MSRPERTYSEASQLIWLENEGAILGRLVPVKKGVTGSRRYELMAGESRLKLQRGQGIGVMVPSYRRLCHISPENVLGLRTARLTRNERDAWDREREELEREEEVWAAEDALEQASGRFEKLEAMERLEALTGETDLEYGLASDARKLMAGAVQVAMPGQKG